MRNKYENERKQLEEVVEGKNNIVKEKGLEVILKLKSRIKFFGHKDSCMI